MALPSGYTRLAYIESTGTQYIDTGYVAKESTVLVAELKNNDTSTVRNILGASDLVYLFNTDGANNIGCFYGGDHFSIKTDAPTTQKFTLEIRSSAIKVNGVTKRVPSYTSFSNATNILLCTRQAGSASARGHITWYSVKIYENDVLVRDFAPCKNASGTVGLYDTVNGEFYTNAGSGTFSYGEIEPSGDHRTMVDAVIWGVPSGRCLVDGVGYNVQKGRTLIDGVGYDVAFGMSVESLAVGSSVFANVNGVRTEFLVVHQGLPSSMYDASCDGTWLLMKNIYVNRAWHSSYSNSYKDSTINTYLNGTFLNLFDADIKAQIKTAKIPHVNGSGNSAVASGSSGLPVQIFLLSGYEVGFTKATSSNFPIDGACLSHFNGTSSVDGKRIAYLNGSATYWWLRSHPLSGTDLAYMVHLNGGFYSDSCPKSYGIRPAFILDSSAAIDPDTFDILG